MEKGRRPSMNTDEILACCLEKKNAYIDFPFGDIPVCVKVCGKLFAQIYPRTNDYKITLKCEPLFGDFYRQRYPGTVVRGYHCPPVQQPFWNTVHLHGDVPEEELRRMIDHAYRVVVSKLPKKLRAELAAMHLQGEEGGVVEQAE
jgi:predicted DNA-binding protein (MmcQ/YjbR family)